jgi:hypothetical protein
LVEGGRVVGNHAKGHLAPQAYRLLKEMQSAAEAANIKLFADYGTLLGACREHKMIRWDSDLDVSVLQEGEDFKDRWDHFCSLMNRRGIRIRRKGSDKRRGLEEHDTGVAVSMSGISSDIFVWVLFDDASGRPQDAFYGLHADNLTPDNTRGTEGHTGAFWGRLRYANTDWRDGKGVYILPAWVESFTTQKFGKVQAIVPVGWKEMLHHRYGDWETPVSQKPSVNAMREFLVEVEGMKWQEAVTEAKRRMGK